MCSDRPAKMPGRLSFYQVIAKMLRSWTHLIAAWFDRQGTHAARRRVRSRRRTHWRREACLVRQLEVLESRELLTSIVAVHVAGNSISLSEVRGGSTSDQITFSVAYTSSQVTLSSSDGSTEFRQAGQT